MRPTPWPDLESRRLLCGGSEYGDDFGAFALLRPDGTRLNVIVGADYGWEHVSVSTPDRCPTWEEMVWVKERFWLPEEVAMQLAVPPSLHINYHSFCLHWWRPTNMTIPLPPRWMVGPYDGWQEESRRDIAAYEARNRK